METLCQWAGLIGLRTVMWRCDVWYAACLLFPISTPMWEY